jgi:CBS domain-containing protein
MTTEVITLNPEETLEDVREHLANSKLHHLPVVEKKKLVGILSTTDLFKLNLPFEQYKSVKVRDVMVSKVGTLSPNDQIGSAAEIFLHNYFHAVPIVNQKRELIGIVTPLDIVRMVHDQHYPAIE